jgi:hypothetical protein
MTHGGKRPGAGRKKGTPNKASAARESKAQASGETPADVLLGAMREFWRLAKKSTNARKQSEYLRAAAAVARDAAPYFHARRVSTAMQPNGKGDEYNPNAGAGGAGDGVREVIHRVEIIGGLPRGSTPEKPEGDDYSDVPPEEPR